MASILLDNNNPSNPIRDINIKNLHNCFNEIVTTAQLFALLPVRGLKHNNAKKITFTWYSLNAIYCHLMLTTTFIVVAMCLYDLVATSVDLYKISIEQHVYSF